MSLEEDREWMILAYQTALKMSEDHSTQNGAVLVRKNTLVHLGANRLPNRIHKYPGRYVRPQKYLFTEHAERVVILRARQDVTGCIMYCPFIACADCARAIILSGIYEVVGHQPQMDALSDHWKDSIRAGLDMLEEAEIPVRFISGDLGIKKILFDGKVVNR